jgi:two-component system, sensor histidine kinase YesM
MWKFVRDMKLHKKLMASFLLACMIPLVIVSLTIYHVAARSLEETSLEFATIYNSQIVTTIDDFVQQIDSVTKSVLIDNDILNQLNTGHDATMNELIDNRLIMQRLLMRISTLRSDIDSIFFISNQSDLYPYYSTNDSVNENLLLEQSWLQQMLRSKDTLFVTPLHDRSYYAKQNGSAVFTVGRSVFTYDGRYAGHLLMDLEPTSLVKLNDKFLIATEDYSIKLMVTTKEGGIVYDSYTASGKSSWDGLLNEPHSAVEWLHDPNMIILSNSSEKGNLIVHTGIPRNRLFSHIDQIKLITIIAISLCFIIVMTLSIVISFGITKPIKLLRNSMKRAEEGRYIAIEPSKSNDEIGSLIYSYNKMMDRIRSLIEDVYLAQIKRRDAKYLALQMQINPHMLYNTLESIRMKAIVNGDDEVASMIKILSRMFKLALGKEKDSHLIRDELDYAENYIQLQNIRFENRFKLDIQLDQQYWNVALTPLVFQPLIENSISHGFYDRGRPLHIAISGEAEGDMLRIYIRDNGNGISAEKAEELNTKLREVAVVKPVAGSESNSIGLSNIAERIKLHYGEQYEVCINPLPEGGTVVEIQIPIVTREE